MVHYNGKNVNWLGILLICLYKLYKMFYIYLIRKKFLNKKQEACYVGKSI
jgi:hypothetical protein